MKTILITTVSEFFKQRAGMFFVFIGILFGFLSGNEHHAFAVFFLTDKYGMLYLLIIWLLYTLLCIHFLLNIWKQLAYGFIYYTRLWSNCKRFYRFIILALGFIQPLLYYGIYMFSVALKDKLLARIWPIFLFYIVLSLAIVVSAEWRIRNPRLFVNKKQGISNFPRPVSWIYWSLEWLLREKGVTLLVCKTGSAIVFVGTLLYYGTDSSYDLRLPAIGLSLGYLLNIGLSYELFQWESSVWLWNRSFPTSMNRRFIRTLILHAIIITPETMIIFRYNVLTLSETVQLYGLGLGILMIFHTYIYKKNGLLEDTMQAVLIGFIVLTLLILYKIPVLIISITGLGFSYYMYPKWFAALGSNKE